MKTKSLLCAAFLGAVVAAPAVNLQFADNQVLINGYPVPANRTLHAMLHRSDPNGTDPQKLNWLSVGTDGGGQVFSSLFQFDLSGIARPSVTVSSTSLTLQQGWMNGSLSFNLYSTLPFNATASWNHPDNPETNAAAGGQLITLLSSVWDGGGTGDRIWNGTNLDKYIQACVSGGTNRLYLALYQAWSPAWNSIAGFSNPRLDLTATLSEGPAILAQPTVSPTNVIYSGNAITQAVVVATDYGTTFQWYKDGLLLDPSTDPRISITTASGVYDSTLIVNDTATTDSGHYYVVVTDAIGSARSITNLVTILPHVPPQITAQPQAVTGYAPGRPVTLTAGVSGTPPFSFQWKHAGADVPGATSQSLTLSGLTTNDAGSYALYVTNSFGWTNTAPCTLTVIPNLCLNPLFGDGIASPDFTDWSPSGSTTTAFDATYGTAAHLPWNWEYISQVNPNVTFQPHTVYTLTAALRGSAGVYGVFNDGTTGDDWLGGGYLWLGSGAWTDYSFTLDTGTTPSVVGHTLGFRFRASNGDVSVADVRVSAAPGAVAPPPTLRAAGWSPVTPGAFQFSIQGWSNVVYEVLVSSNLTNWSTLTTVTNLTGADTFTDTTAASSPKFYRLLQK